ncbi:DoxX family protein [Sphingomonas sp.]|uniref:DoxX family protein n=1 Tax=Sphingomonas sp. TaxID=28214 RepID=UPI0025D0A8D9|nr:DoxX family protein [Sphingomonas sp.]MBV9529467.1 DoxX family protein [Sphingomonas sp.]
MELPWLSRWQPQLLAVLRIVAGLLFVEHATQKFFAFPVPFPMPGPLPPIEVAAATIELFAGALVTIGLFTRLAAFIASGEMAVGYFMAHFPKSFWPAANMGEAAILFCFIFLYLAAAGPGAWSIDGLRLRNQRIH